MLLPYFINHDVSVDILALDPSVCTDPIDHWQSANLPVHVPVYRVSGLPLATRHIPGLGSIESRSFFSLSTFGDKLLRRTPYSAVFFSTTAFQLFTLGIRWRKKFNIPYILDYQDPWVNSFYAQNPSIRPPGGYLKYSIVNRLHRISEPPVLKSCSGIVSVSQSYISEIFSRYSFLPPIPSLVLPFPGSPLDFDKLPKYSCPSVSTFLPFDPSDGFIHWISVGRGGSDMSFAIRSLFVALRLFNSPSLLERLRIHFIGTSYSPSGQGIPTILPLATEYGLTEIVREHTDRVPLSVALHCLKSANALLVIGSSDPTYTASKIYPYLLAKRPLLAIMNESSSVCDVLRTCGGGTLVTFNSSSSIHSTASNITTTWLSDQRFSCMTPLDSEAFYPFTAEYQAKQFVEFMKMILSH